MMLGKRGRRPSFRRTTSMTGIEINDASESEAPPPPPTGFDHILSPRYLRKTSSDVATADFLRICGLCNRRLKPGRDIYMYRGDTAFCSLECRDQHIEQDETKEKRAAINGAVMVDNKGNGHHPEAETVAAAS